MILRWSLLLFCGWLAASVSGVAGFGGALLLLPVLAFAVGGKAAVPILTVAQLLGNLSRAGFGWRDIQWRPALLFSLGAVPASLFGSRLFVAMPSTWVPRAVGLLLLAVVALRHTGVGKRKVPEQFLAFLGIGVGFVSAVAGSAGPLGAAVFLSLDLGPQAYVATEAVTAVLMHLAKSLAYGRYSALSLGDSLRGLLLGGSLVLGSWTGRKLIDRMPERWFGRLVDGLLLVSALALIVAR